MDETLKDIHILIVDDEESIRITFEMFLKREGYGRIVTAATFEEALFAINEERFDLIISDIVLEGATGTELLRYVRQTGIQCPVVMITGFPNLESATEAVRHGAFDYISKPVNKETLLRFVRQALNNWRLQKEKAALQQENEKFRRYLEVIFSSVSDAIITVNKKMEITKLNDTARNWLEGCNAGASRSLQDIPGEMGQALLIDAGQVIENGSVVREHQIECRKVDGSVRMISLNASPLRDAVDEFNGAVLVARDISPALPEELQDERPGFHRFIGVSGVMQDVYRLIENVGRVDTAVLITGESGTGKELAAEALHAESRRRDRPLVKVDCAAMPEDLLESELFGHRKGAFTGADRDRPGRLLQADKGSLFLDEIGDISPRMQLRLLRFLQEKTFNPVGQDDFVRVDVRIMAATNVDLKKNVKAGTFREDLYYRLKVVEVRLPPLRERKDCIHLLVHHFLTIFRNELDKKIVGVSDQAMEVLKTYGWPGNVRELRHVIERACVLCKGSTLRKEHLAEELLLAPHLTPAPNGNEPSSGREYPDEGAAARQQGPYLSEQQQIIQALQATGGNKAKAARLLGFDRSTLYRKMQRHGI